jgi:ATP-dependent RNA helicase HelY
MHLKVLTGRSRRLTLGPADFDEPPTAIGSIDLPVPYLPNSSSFQREATSLLRRARIDSDGSGESAVDEVDPVMAQLRELSRLIDVHPVASCPDLQRHRRAASQLERLDRERGQLERQIQGRSTTLARELDRVLQLLEAWGYLHGWAPTPKGERLARLFHEADLLLAEALHDGVFDDLAPAELAGLVSTFTYERRGSEEGPAPWFPSPELRRRWGRIEELHARVADAEEGAGLPITRALDPGFVALAYAWASGDELPAVLEDEDLSGGDFVRVVKQLIDVLRQLAEAAPLKATSRAAVRAADSLYRGVVASTSVVPGADPAP